MSNPKRLRLLASLPVRFQDMRDDQLNFELELRGFSESDFKQLSRLEREQWLRTLRESEREDMKEKQRIKSAQEGVTQQSQHGVFYSGLCRLGTEMLFTLCDFLDSVRVVVCFVLNKQIVSSAGAGANMLVHASALVVSVGRQRQRQQKQS